MLPSTIKPPVVTLTGNPSSVEDSLRISEERFRSVADNNNVWVWETDAAGRYTFASQAVEKILGYTPSEVVGMNCLEFADPRDKHIVLQTDQQAQKKEPFQKLIFRGTQKNGMPVWLSSSGFPLTDNHGQIIGYRGSTVDITVFKVTEEEKLFSEEKYRDANEKLSEALDRAELLNEKLSVIGGFTRHDVRNKLMAISGNVYLAEKYAGESDRLLASLNRIKGTVNNITSILNFAKDFEMLGNQTLADIDVGKALDEATSLFSDHKVTITNQCKGVIVHADAMLTTVFHNLIDNSIRYGEKVTEIKVYKKTEGDTTKIVYEDNGIGVDEETRRNLFVKGYGKGTGYGLYLIKRACEFYGWQIQETGQVGKGVCFEFILKSS
jgi:PAS domain S-box-containing protein